MCKTAVHRRCRANARARKLISGENGFSFCNTPCHAATRRYLQSGLMHHTFSPFRHLLAILERIVPIDRLPVDREVVSHEMQDVFVGADKMIRGGCVRLSTCQGQLLRSSQNPPSRFCSFRSALALEGGNLTPL